MSIKEKQMESNLLLSATQAANLCGISVRQWWRWDSSGKIPRAVMIGCTKRWRRIELEKWVEEGCPSRTQIDSK